MKSEVMETVDEPTERQIVVAKQEEAIEILEGFQDFEIEDDDDYEVVAEGVKEVKRIAKDIDARRKKVTAPLNAALAEFRSWYKPALDLLERTEMVLKGKLGVYERLQEARSREAMEAAAAAAREGDFDGAHEASKGIVSAPSVKGVTIVRYWDYEIEDISKVPRRYLCLDHSAVKIYIKAAGKEEPAPIPGLRFVSKDRGIVRVS
jgi:hypothetical protein